MSRGEDLGISSPTTLSRATDPLIPTNSHVERFTGWWYLRFFQPHGDGDFRGDRSETFAFIYWFPPPVR